MLRPRFLRFATVAAAGGATALVALVDPGRAAPYPPCPSKLVLGIDCPACGGLRGTHALLHGHVLQALDHNVLLPGLLAVLGLALVLWLLPLVGRPAARLAIPRAVMVPAIAVVVAFTILRNLPVGSLEFLASGASG